jgi:hypothetical protein
MLDHFAGTYLRLCRVLTRMAPGPALAEKVPALVELDFDLTETGPLRLGQLPLTVVSLQLMFLVHQLVDLPD